MKINGLTPQQATELEEPLKKVAEVLGRRSFRVHTSTGFSSSLNYDLKITEALVDDEDDEDDE